MNEIDGEVLLLAALDAQLLYVQHASVFGMANRVIRKTVHELRSQGENPLDHQTLIADDYMQAVSRCRESVATALEQDLDTLAEVVGRTCLLSFFDETRDQHLAVFGEDVYKSFSMRLIRSGLEPSIPVQLTYGFGLVPYIEAAATDGAELTVIPGVIFNPVPEVGQRTVSFPWSVVDKIEVEG